jgi:HAD superfamily hydrolase (TIGR01509 family)
MPTSYRALAEGRADTRRASYDRGVIRAVVFDFDGVILDTETPDFVSWREVFTDHGVELTIETWSQGLGTYPSSFDVYEHLTLLSGRTVEVEAIRVVRRARNDALIADETVRPGIEAWIADARRLGIKLGIASSSPVSWIEGHLERLGLRDTFDCIRCADHVTATKPSPELYLAACEGLGVSPDEAIAIEDSPNGTTAAKGAGLFCVAVPNSVTVALDLSAADFCVDSLALVSLEDVIARAER